jgi:hypothetical protein
MSAPGAGRVQSDDDPVVPCITCGKPCRGGTCSACFEPPGRVCSCNREPLPGEPHSPACVYANAEGRVQACNECGAEAWYEVRYTDGSHASPVCRRHLARVVRTVLDVEGYAAEVVGLSAPARVQSSEDRDTP